jgi:ATP adenylyltransferase
LNQDLYFLGNARSEEQRREMAALESAGICIFCPSSYQYGGGEPEVLLDYGTGRSYRKQVLEANGTWAILRNEYPYPGTTEHVMLVPSAHVTNMEDLDWASRIGFWEILDRAATIYGQSGFYGLGVRNGDMRFTGGTIAHLHVHLVVGDVHSPGHEPVRLKISSTGQENPPS